MRCMTGACVETNPALESSFALRAATTFAIGAVLLLGVGGCTSSVSPDELFPSAGTVAAIPSSDVSEQSLDSSDPVSTSSTASGDPDDQVAVDQFQPAPTSSVADGRRQVTVVVTRAGVLAGVFTIGAMVEAVVEEGGTCTATVAQGQTILTVEGPARPSASTTDCGDGLEIPTSQLSSGTWTVSVSYDSELSRGDSREVEVTIE